MFTQEIILDSSLSGTLTLMINENTLKYIITYWGNDQDIQYVMKVEEYN